MPRSGWVKTMSVFPMEIRIAKFFTFMKKLLNNLAIWMSCDSVVLFSLLSVTFVDEETFIIFQKMFFIYYILQFLLLSIVPNYKEIKMGGWGGMCITTSGNYMASGSLCFIVFKLQLNVINKNICYLYSVWVNQIN